MSDTRARSRIYGQALIPVPRQATAGGGDPLDDAAALVRAIAGVSAQHPHFVKLLMSEGSSGGPRLDEILTGPRPLQDAIAALLPRLHEQGRPHQFDDRTFLLFLLLADAGPFALNALVDHVLGAATTPALAAETHAERVLLTLFDRGPNSPLRGAEG